MIADSPMRFCFSPIDKIRPIHSLNGRIDNMPEMDQNVYSAECSFNSADAANSIISCY